MSKAIEHYQHLHLIPELGFTEFKTSAYIAQALEDAGFNVTRHVNGTTGIIAEIDSGKRAGVATDVAEKLKALERENRELRQANEILRKASAYFAQAELDRRVKP